MLIRLQSPCTTGSFGESFASNSRGRIKCVSLNNRPCQDRPRLFDINSNKSLYYPFISLYYQC